MHSGGETSQAGPGVVVGVVKGQDEGIGLQMELSLVLFPGTILVCCQ